jgi:hypothetical protein
VCWGEGRGMVDWTNLPSPRPPPVHSWLQRRIVSQVWNYTRGSAFGGPPLATAGPYGPRRPLNSPPTLPHTLEHPVQVLSTGRRRAGSSSVSSVAFMHMPTRLRR